VLTQAQKTLTLLDCLEAQETELLLKTLIHSLTTVGMLRIPEVVKL
jgi:hypothetical protein